jgi:hypothetical protein
LKVIFMPYSKKQTVEQKADTAAGLELAQAWVHEATQKVENLKPKGGHQVGRQDDSAYGDALRDLGAAQGALSDAMTAKTMRDAMAARAISEDEAPAAIKALTARIEKHKARAKAIDGEATAQRRKIDEIQDSHTQCLAELEKARQNAAKSILEGVAVTGNNTRELQDRLDNLAAAIVLGESTLEATQAKQHGEVQAANLLQDQLDAEALLVAEAAHTAALEVYLPVLKSWQKAKRKAGHGYAQTPDLDRELRLYAERHEQDEDA